MKSKQAVKDKLRAHVAKVAAAKAQKSKESEGKDTKDRAGLARPN